MTEAPLQINALIIDADGPERLAAFWSELLGRPIVNRTGPYVWLRRERGLGLGFQQAGEPKAGVRMHFDITSPDPGAERQRVEALEGDGWKRRRRRFPGDGRPPGTSSASSPRARAPSASMTRGTPTTSLNSAVRPGPLRAGRYRSALAYRCQKSTSSAGVILA
ncbi:hypothetical protein SMICM17S_03299 [Streptomyces microflavus]